MFLLAHHIHKDPLQRDADIYISILFIKPNTRPI